MHLPARLAVRLAAIPLSALLLPSTPLAAQEQPLELASPLVDDMILQRQMKVPVWGWADPGSRITVSFADQEKTAVAGGKQRA